MATSPRENDDWLAEYERTPDLPGIRPRLIRPVEPEWIVCVPPFDDDRPSDRVLEHRGMAPALLHKYTDAEGAPIGYVARYERGTKEKAGTIKADKTFLPFTYGRLDAEPEGSERWDRRGWRDNRPVFGLARAMAFPAAPLLVVEGEKKVDIAARLFLGCVAISWPGGAASAGKVNWSVLKGRENLKAIIFPDNDEPGTEAASVIAAELSKLGYFVEIVDVSHMPEHWDIGDAGDWTTTQAAEFYDKHKRDFFWTDPVVEVRRAAAPAPSASPEPQDPYPDILPPDVPEHLKEAADKLLQDSKRTQIRGGSHAEIWNRAGVEVLQGKPVPNVSNVSLLLDYVFPNMVWFDEFLGRIRTRNASRDETRDWGDPDDIRITIEMQRNLGMSKVSREIVHQAIIEHAYRNVRNELREWIAELPAWDGIERRETFFIDCAGAKDTEYTRAVGRNFWTGMAARALRPGCKLDTMVILEGGQGKLKSTLLEVIGGRWYAIMASSPDSKDFAIDMTGKLILELAEMEVLSRSGINTVKRTLRTASDRYRSPYGTYSADHPRSSILAGTTNRDDYNMDETGMRHGWPILCDGDIRIDLVTTNRSQLFAESVASLERGDSWWEMPLAATRIEQQSRYVGDAWEADVMEAVRLCTTTTVAAVLEKIGVDISRRGRSEQMRVAGILKMAGWTKDVVWDGKTVRRWRRNQE